MTLAAGDAAPLAPDLYDYDFDNDPAETLMRLRREDPVHWSSPRPPSGTRAATTATAS